MSNVDLVLSFKAVDQLSENTPDFLFFEELAFLFLFVYFVLQVSALCILHDYAETTAHLFEESLLVRDYVLVPTRVIQESLTQLKREF